MRNAKAPEIAADDDAGAVVRKCLHVRYVLVEAAVAGDQILFHIREVKRGYLEAVVSRISPDRLDRLLTGHIADERYDAIAKLHGTDELKRIFVSKISDRLP